jgi:hypothetical protein
LATSLKMDLDSRGVGVSIRRWTADARRKWVGVLPAGGGQGSVGGSVLDVVVAGCSPCEVLRCDGTGQSIACVLHLATKWSEATIVAHEIA